MRIIFAGSSALSSRSVTLAAMMSRVREKMPIGNSLMAAKAVAGSWIMPSVRVAAATVDCSGCAAGPTAAITAVTLNTSVTGRR